MTTEKRPRANLCRRLVPVAVGLALALAGCGEPGVSSTTYRKAIPVKELPETVLTAAQKAVPGVTFTDAWKNLERGAVLQSYELKGRNAKGKIREVRVDPTGKILELE